MSLIAVSDFTGRWKIPVPFDGNAKLQAYIDYYEPKYLNDLFGAELYVLFAAGVTAETEIYEKLNEPFAFDSDIIEEPVMSMGVNHMLKCLIYAHYWSEDLAISTSVGKVEIVPEAGKLQNDNYNNNMAYYNEGIKTYKAIQMYIEENLSTYPTFKGVKRGLTWFF